MRRATTAMVGLLVGLLTTPLGAEGLPEGYWGLDRSGPILEKTLTLHLAPDLSDLSANERKAVERLLGAGEILHRLYERQNHHQAEVALERLQKLNEGLGSPEETQSLLKLHRIFKGPIATTLDNRRVAFLPVDEEEPGRNVYPRGLTREELDAFLAASPERREEILGLRTAVRRVTRVALDRDLETLERHAVLSLLHPGLQRRLEALREAGEEGFYSVPYAVAYADEIIALYDLLSEAAAFLHEEDPELAGYLRHRARDLLTGDYEAGDAAWVTGCFGDLNAQIGSYETYDDELYGVKAFYSLSLLLRDRQRSERLASAISGLQALQDELPGAPPRRVREGIPVNVYHVIADFGQARGTNTATILPNEAEHTRKYGRTILLRYNIMTHPDLFALAQARFRAAVAPELHDDLTLEGGFQRTLWHEIGHYLGVDRTEDGRSLDVALAQHSDLIEELKSDLLSLFAARSLAEGGYLTPEGLRSFYAGGVLRVLQVVKPRREQPYQTMQLMQWNYFLENGLLLFDAASGRLHIDYDRYHRVVEKLLGEVLATQLAGDPERAGRLVERWGYWKDDLHEVLAARIRETQRYRYRLVRYAALGEE